MIAETDEHIMREEKRVSLWKGYYRPSKEFPTAKNLDVSLRWVLQRAVEDSKCVDIDYRVLGGTPTIKDTRVPVYMILQAIEYHESLQAALEKAYPQLNIDQIRDAVLFAASVLECSVDGD